MLQTHSIAFSVDKEVEVPEKYGPWCRVVSRTPSFPAFCPDLSLPAINETIERRAAHSKLLERRPNAFRKTDSGGTGEYMQEKHKLRNYLTDIHPLTLQPTQSRLPPKKKNLDSSLDDAPLTDFSLPAGPTRPRTTGYSPGHIRTMLALDTFGPLDSAQKEAMRDSGAVPMSPNADHWKPLNDCSKPSEHEFVFPTQSPGPEAPGSNQGLKQLSTKTGVSTASVMGDQGPFSLSNSKNSLNKKKKRSDRGGPNSVASDEMSKSQKTLFLTPEELATLDPFTRSKQWHKSYEADVQHNKLKMAERVQRLATAQSTELLAVAERSSISNFEQSLKQKLQHA